MNDALQKMKKADGDLNFKRDRQTEERILLSQGERDKVLGRETPNNRVFMIHRLGTGDNEVTVLMFWEHKGFFPKFNDLAVMPNHKERQDLSVKGIAYTE